MRDQSYDILVRTMARRQLITSLVIGACLMGQAAPRQTTLADVLMRAEEYVAAYEEQFPALAADERHEQAIVRRLGTADRPQASRVRVTERSRLLAAEIIMIHGTVGESWSGYRDVFEVDSRAVGSGRGRLVRLFRESPREVATAGAARANEASAQHDIGDVRREFKAPTLALIILHRRQQHRFHFERAAEETIDGTPAWAVRFTEQAQPTLFHSRKQGGDLFARGTLWIDPEQGRLLRSHVTITDQTIDVRASITVAFRADESVGGWVPAEMKEVYDRPDDPKREIVEGTATYSNFRVVELASATDREPIPIPLPPPASADQSAMALVLGRAQAYVADYEKRFSAIVAEERYLQQLWWAPRATVFPIPDRGRPKRTRSLRSDVLMVPLPALGWFGFRDVFEVDGRIVRNRQERLQKLFLRPSTTRQITRESARYNIGSVQRTINVPTYALLFLHPRHESRSSFKIRDAETGTSIWVLDFLELARPTLTRTTNNRDLFARGSFWVVPEQGLVTKSHLVYGDVASEVRGRISVTYGREPALDLWVPVTMTEVYDYPRRPWDDYVECLASYSNFRRFSVSVGEKIVLPK